MKESYTKKLFFKKYDHRVTVVCKAKNYKGRREDYLKRPTTEMLQELAEAELGEKKYRTRETSHMIPCKSKKRRNSWWGGYYRPMKYDGELITIYFKGTGFYDTLKDKFGDHLHEVERPLNEQHTEAMSKDRMIVRKQLFHKKYRYCIRTSPKYATGSYSSSKKHIDEMKAWHASTFKHLEAGVDYYIYDGWNANFFFANPQDAMMMKLTWGEYIDSTDRIVLISELEGSEECESETASA